MSHSDPLRHYLSWPIFGVQAAAKEPLYRFLCEALEESGCKIIHRSATNEAPLLLVFETKGGLRQATLIYTFLANAKVTRNRPPDEHRLQIKFGGDLSGSINFAVDPHEIVTTLLLGVDPERGFVVSADPLLNSPSPQSRSIEFKAHRVEEILSGSWAAWTRARRPAKTTSRPAFEAEMDLRSEVLVGARKDRLLDLIAFERIARGLDPGERHLLADSLGSRTSIGGAHRPEHPILRELALDAETLLELIEGAPRLKMAVRGWTAEHHLEQHLKALPQVTECRRLNEDRLPDIALRWKGGPEILIECKNALRERTKKDEVRVDFQRTRASKTDPSSRYYAPSEFDLLAVCLHAVEARWRFAFARTKDLPTHPLFEAKLKNTLRVTEPPFYEALDSLLD